MVFTQQQKDIFTKHNIQFEDKPKYSNEETWEILEQISDEMTVHVDKNDEPLPTFLLLQDLYDEIYYSFEE